jgi:hypothetical protein
MGKYYSGVHDMQDENGCAHVGVKHSAVSNQHSAVEVVPP